ncbi:hypothetical protein [Persicobacter diffluens]
MKKFLFSCLMVLGLMVFFPKTEGKAQNFNLVGHFGATMLNRPAKFLFDVEGQFGVTRTVMLTSGYQHWDNKNHATFGMRIYPVDGFYLRARGLFWNSADVSLGAGFTKYFDQNWLMEFSGDYYINAKRMGLQVGIGYRF